MMTSPELVLPVFTVKSDWICRYGALDVEPYDRVVGIGVPDSDEPLWTVDVVPEDFESKFDPKDTEREELKLPHDMALNLISFFKKHLRDNDGERDLFYNCHRFAYNLGGSEPQSGLAGTISASEVIKFGEKTDPPLDIGRHAVYGAFHGEGSSARGLPQPLHSVVGLGQEEERCLQVGDMEGHLGLRKYVNIDAYYQNFNQDLYYAGLKNLGFYTATPNLV